MSKKAWHKGLQLTLPLFKAEGAFDAHHTQNAPWWRFREAQDPDDPGRPAQRNQGVQNTALAGPHGKVKAGRSILVFRCVFL